MNINIVRTYRSSKEEIVLLRRPVEMLSPTDSTLLLQYEETEI